MQAKLFKYMILIYLHLTLINEFAACPGGKAGEGVAGEQADQRADQDVAQVVFADKDAADGYEWRPDEHPDAICLEPEGYPSA